jgi:hypothetical protein
VRGNDLFRSNARGAIAGVEHGFASIGEEHDREQIDAELGKAGGQPEPTPGLGVGPGRLVQSAPLAGSRVLPGFVERLGIARSGARTGASNIDLHVPISRSPVPSIYSRSGCPVARACTGRSSPRPNLHDGSFVPHLGHLPTAAESSHLVASGLSSLSGSMAPERR